MAVPYRHATGFMVPGVPHFATRLVPPHSQPRVPRTQYEPGRESRDRALAMREVERLRRIYNETSITWTALHHRGMDVEYIERIQFDIYRAIVDLLGITDPQGY